MGRIHNRVKKQETPTNILGEIYDATKAKASGNLEPGRGVITASATCAVSEARRRRGMGEWVVDIDHLVRYRPHRTSD